MIIDGGGGAAHGVRAAIREKTRTTQQIVGTRKYVVFLGE